MMEKITYLNNSGFPPTICIQLLKWCNLTCKYCRASSSPFEHEQLRFEDIKRLLEGVKEYGNWRISLTGGEPFYYPELLSLLQVIDRLEYPFSITTNGYASLKQFNAIPEQLFQNGTLYISIDGTQDIHNNLRGPKSYEKAIGFIRAARVKVRRLNVNTVLYSHPSFWAEKLYGVLGALNVNNWTIISPVSSGRWPVDVQTAISYEEQYEYIKNVAEKSKYRTTTTFLNFAAKQKSHADVVFVDSDGTINLPGFYSKEGVKNNDLLTRAFVSDQDVSAKIALSVAAFIHSEKYML